MGRCEVPAVRRRRSIVRGCRWALAAIWIAERPPTQERTYGYLRVEVLCSTLQRGMLVVLYSLRPNPGGSSAYRPKTAAMAAAQAFSMKLESLDHVAISVRDVARSAAWYCEVLGLDRLYEEAWGSDPAVVAAGGTGLALFPVEGAGQPPPGHDVLTMRHVAFRVNAAGFQTAQTVLRRRGVPFTFEDHAISRSIYLHDPDGHRIELTTYDRQ